MRAAERVVAEAKTVLVAYDYDRARSVEIPDEWKERLARLMPVFERTTLDNGLRLLTASMPQVASTTCFIFLAAGSRYETRGDERHRALRRAHVLQGNRAAPDRARHRRRDRRHRRRVQRVHRQGVHRLLRQVRRRAPRDRARRAHRHAAPLEVRAGGDRAREGRHRRGDEHVLRHAARLHRRRVRATSSSATSRSAGTSSAARRPSAARRARRSSTTSSRWYKPSRMVVGIAGRLDDGVAAEVERAVRRPRAAATTARRRRCSRCRTAAARTSRCTRSSPTRRTSSSAFRAGRWTIPTGTSCRCSRRCSAAGCRRACSRRCASGAASRTTSTASTTATPTPARCTRRQAST